MGERRSGGAESATEALTGRATPEPPASPAELVKAYTKPELKALALQAYKSGSPDDLALLGALTPSEKYYLATQEEFQHYIIALMFDAVIGNERVTKCQRSAASWFHRVIADHKGDRDQKRSSRVPEDAKIVDAGADDE